MEKLYRGIASSDGIGIGDTYVLKEVDLSWDDSVIKSPKEEQYRLDDALVTAIADIKKIKNKALDNLGAEEAQVFDAHLMILQDPEVLKAISNKIAMGKYNAESALMSEMNSYADLLASMEDNPYMQERSGDVLDVAKRVLSYLVNKPLPSLALIDKPTIVVADELTPSDTAQLDKSLVKGFVTRLGGRTSHSAIMARTLEIPAVVGVEDLDLNTISNDMPMVVDGSTGEVHVDVHDLDILKYRKNQSAYVKQQKELTKLVDKPSLTADNKEVKLVSNIGTPEDLDQVIANGAEGIGLMRSEFLYMNSDKLPDEETQFEAYKQVIIGLNGKPVTIRTMDIGGDKELPYLELPDEMNPFLGYRAIRISLNESDLFRTQIRALLRASAFGDLRIMFPMIATLDELRQAKEIVHEEMEHLDQEGQLYDAYIKLGMMIEIPASAMLADQFAKEVDFFSIGTNDLIQYMFAADRGNDKVSYLYQPLNPALLRTVKNVIDSAHAEGTFVAMCGEMASDPLVLPLLLGMGLDEFSMSATSILKTRELIGHYDSASAKTLVENAIKQGTTKDVVALVKDYQINNSK